MCPQLYVPAKRVRATSLNQFYYKLWHFVDTDFSVRDAKNFISTFLAIMNAIECAQNTHAEVEIGCRKD